MSEEHSTESLPGEIWKAVAAFPLYEVSNLGRIRSWRNGRWGKNAFPRVLKLTPASHGYPTVGLSRDGEKQVTYCVHILVLEAFVGPCPEGMETLHGSTNKQDCSLANLSWGTPQENQGRDRLRDKTDNRGERNPNSALTQADVLSIWRRLKDGETQSSIAESFGVCQGTVSAIKCGVSWGWLAEPAE